MRGIRTFETSTRNTSDIDAICILKDRFSFSKNNYEIFFDPSHACGNRKFVKQLSICAIVAGCDGLEIEIHSNPDEAISDALQTIDFKTFLEISKLYEKTKRQLA